MTSIRRLNTGDKIWSERPSGPGNPLSLRRARDWGMQLFLMNEEFPVTASHKLALITSPPFVHTAHRCGQLLPGSNSLFGTPLAM